MPCNFRPAFVVELSLSVNGSYPELLVICIWQRRVLLHSLRFVYGVWEPSPECVASACRGHGLRSWYLEIFGGGGPIIICTDITYLDGGHASGLSTAAITTAGSSRSLAALRHELSHAHIRATNERQIRGLFVGRGGDPPAAIGRQPNQSNS